jgi:hypothetical protein
MKGTRRFLVFVFVVILVVALPMTALASKQIFQASLTTGTELHEVVGSTARSSFNLGHNPDGTMRFILTVRNLSGEAAGAHIHGPATEDENGPVLLTLCGSPAPSAGGDCITDSSGTLQVSADITLSVLQQVGLTGAQFLSYLNDGLLYVNVHTSLIPAGEARGQIFQR